MKLSGPFISTYPSFSRLLVVTGFLYVVFFVFDKTPLSYLIESRVSLPALFKIRDLIGKSAGMSSTLKILSYDDTTLGNLGKADLSVLEWAKLLEKISEKHPKAIYIDKLFTLNTPDTVEMAQAAEIFQKLATPVISISFVWPNSLPARKTLDLANPRYDILSLYPNRFALMTSSFVPMLDRQGWKVYGPHESLQPYFQLVGHALNAEYGKTDPLIQISPSKVLPHVAFVGPFALSVKGSELFAAGHKIPTDSKGEVVINFFDRASFFSSPHTTRILSVVSDIVANRPVSNIESGDTVLILPGMYTGGTDFIQTALGPMPGGYVIASLLNSLLTNRWIEPAHWEGWSVFVACLLGVPVVFFSGIASWIYVACLIILYGGMAVSLFSFQGFLVNVSGPFGAFLTSVMTFTTFRNQVREKLMLFMRVLKTENDELRSEIDQASQIAKVFNPDQAPSWGRIKVSAYHETLIAASGDWYAFEESKSGAFQHVLMCDITGHGVQAAIIVSTCKTVLSLVTQQFPEYLEGFDFLDRYAKMLNATLYSQGRGHHVTTLAGISINLTEKKVRYVTAGHPPPLLFRENLGNADKIVTLNTRNNPLGLFGDFNPECAEVSLATGDTIIVYTDGMVIPRNPRLIIPVVRAMVENKVDGDSARRLAERLKGLVALQVRTAPADDLSLVIVHIEN